MALKLAFADHITLTKAVTPLGPGGAGYFAHPYFYQEQTNWCWAACAAMLIKGKLHQCQIASLALSKPSCCSTSSSAICNRHRQDPQITSLIRSLGLSCTFTKSLLSFTEVKNQITLHKVMQVGFSWGETTGGHVLLVIDAFNNNDVDTVLVSDPDEGTGQGICTYQFLTTAYGLGSWDVSWSRIH